MVCLNIGYNFKTGSTGRSIKHHYYQCFWRFNIDNINFFKIAQKTSKSYISIIEKINSYILY
jgi:hypothetical protein